MMATTRSLQENLYYAEEKGLSLVKRRALREEREQMKKHNETCAKNRRKRKAKRKQR